MPNLQELENSKERIENRIVELGMQIDNFVIDEDNCEEAYQEFIDDATGPITILGMEYCASTVLAEVDPIAYGCELSNFVNGMDVTDDPEHEKLVEELEDLEDELADTEEAIEDAEEENE
jgi:hypothetical protein